MATESSAAAAAAVVSAPPQPAPASDQLLTASQTVAHPLDLVRLSLAERVRVKCRGGRVLEGVLHAFDEHLNMVLGKAREAITTVDLDPETDQPRETVERREIELIFVRGDSVIFVSPGKKKA